MVRGLIVPGALILGLVAGAGSVSAQSGRPWVDPPAEPAAPSASEPKPAEEAKPAQAPAAPQPTEAKADPQPSAPAEKKKKTASKPKRTQEARTPPRTRRLVERPEPRVRLATPEVEAGTYPAYPSSRYEVMRLRTIELPDGRRVQVLTRPSTSYPSYPAYPTYQTYPY